MIRDKCTEIQLLFYWNRLNCLTIHRGGIGCLHDDGVLRAPLYALSAEDATEAINPPVVFFPINSKSFGRTVFRAEGTEDTGRGIETDMAPGVFERSSGEFWVHLAGGLPEEVAESGLEHR